MATPSHVQAAILANPFSLNNQPKLMDGKREQSSGLHLRSTGEIALNTTGITYIALIPGHANTVCWRTLPSTIFAPVAFSGHLSTDVDRANVKQARVVSAALRLTMINNADQNEGYWEAARIPAQPSDFTVDAITGIASYTPITGGTTVPDIDLSNHQTYQSGKIRDLHRLQFKLNSVNTIHEFTFLAGVPNADQFIDEAFDIILIKLHGRADSASPTQVMYDAMSNQEVVYKQNTSLSRLMTANKKVMHYDFILEKANYRLPAMRNMDAQNAMSA